MRIEVFYRQPNIDGRANKILKLLQSSVSTKIKNIALADIYLTNCSKLSKEQAVMLFSDKVAQQVKINDFACNSILPHWNYLVEITYRAGVNDPIAITAKKAIETELEKKLEDGTVVQTATQFILESDPLSHDEQEKLLNQLFNKLIQRATFLSKEEWNNGKRMEELYSYKVAESSIQIETFPIKNLNEKELENLSKKRLLALSAKEMEAVKAYYSQEEILKKRKTFGLSEEPTDVELEMIGQTWSEHCKHKILGSHVEYSDLETGKKETIQSLFKEFIKNTTEALWEKKPFLRSVFVDDSGVIEFDKDHLVCFKVETHNSPSALDPYGGAITGIVGVNRDIMGTGKSARPIFNTNVLCFGDPNTPEECIPSGLLHPRQVLSGVHHGIVDGGNQSGIPVVAGGFIFDDSYIGKPLVFCGTGGILPATINNEGSWIKHIEAGDLAVMIGGRIGKDGIHGATFSSLVLDEESPTSAVQIGDPITQKKFNDFLQEARDKALFLGITDNGAGGLSSSMGEMAESSGGLHVDLKKAPLKYQGLAPWEIWVSESQERMSLAVKPEKIESFLALAKARDVEATVLGEFTDSGYIELSYGDEPVAYMELAFLHEGLPKMNLKAEWKAPKREKTQPEEGDQTEMLLKILADPSVASKEPLIRQYDHEVQAQSVIKPFVGVHSDAPSDGAVLRPVMNSNRGLTITHGICQRYSDLDTYQMAANAVDEAFRAHIALGGDPETASALDNFCWPDPVESDYTPDGKYKMAQLVRCCKGLKESCLAYGLPLISGKDSMKNDSQLGGKKVSVRPTLLISLMGIIKDLRLAQTTDFKKEEEFIYILGETRGELGGSTYEKVSGKLQETVPEVRHQEAFSLYKKTHIAITQKLITSIHDLSDGGLAVALAESALGGQLGANINLDPLFSNQGKTMESARVLFCETPSRFIATIKKENQAEFEKTLKGSAFYQIGITTKEPKINVSLNQKNIIDVDLVDIEKAWKRFEN